MGTHAKTVRMYAGWNEKAGTYSHFYKNQRIVEGVCGYAPEDVHLVELREVSEGEAVYWGWEDADTREWSMIWPTRVQFRMCFTYGLDAAIKAGQGRPVQLAVQHVDHPNVSEV